MRFLPASDRALLVELDDLTQTMALYRQCLAEPMAGVQALVPAARTLLVQYQPWVLSAAALRHALAQRAQTAWRALDKAQRSGGRVVDIPVHYTGEDLPDVAEILGISVQEVVVRHTGQPYDAAFAGFAPGFVYLSGGANFQVPRRATPRTQVPAGSVALGGGFSAVYPKASPGGWQLLGVTELAMWDLARAEPALIQPGFQVQFVDAARRTTQVMMPRHPAAVAMAEVETVGGAAVQLQAKIALALSMPSQAAIEFKSVGLQTLFQDRGRHGMEGLGVSASGALDQAAMRQANRMVGNPVHTPVLENLLGQLCMRAHGACTVAIAGADVALHLQTAAGSVQPIPCGQAVALNDGDGLTLGAVKAGMRCYVAVRGGWGVEPVLGSCATDTLAQVGPAALQPGQRVPVGQMVSAAALQAVSEQHEPLPGLPRAGDTVTLDVVLGPRTDWFSAQGVATLTGQTWVVTPQSNRIGIRLQGAQPLARSVHGELPSEGTVLGAIQVPISGQPVLFLADHPLTGGYPVIAALASYHLDLAAQIPVGCQIQFKVVADFDSQHSSDADAANVLPS